MGGLEHPIQRRFENWRLLGKPLSKIFLHNFGAHLKRQMSAAL
jgi:hypothetical protein